MPNLASVRVQISTHRLWRLRGAAAADYRDAGLAWGPKNAPFQKGEESQQAFGMTPELYAFGSLRVDFLCRRGAGFRWLAKAGLFHSLERPSIYWLLAPSCAAAA
jgi:hypothetical protein